MKIIRIFYVLALFMSWAINAVAVPAPPVPTAYSLSGAVRGCQTNGGGISAVTVTLSGATNLSVLTDTNGGFSFTNLPSGSYTVTPSQPGNVFTPATVTLILSSNTVLASFVAANPVIQGTLIYQANGLGIPGHPVVLTGGPQKRMTLTDSNGYFIFTNCPAGNYTIAPQLTNGFRPQPTVQQVTLSATNCSAYLTFSANDRTVELVALEVVQVIQDWNNSIPLIAAKKTFVRAHLQLPELTPYYLATLVQGARLYGPGGASVGIANPNGSLLVQTTDAGTVRSNWNSTLNFELPLSWCTGTVPLRFVCTNFITVIPTNTAPATFIVNATFVPMPVLPLKFYGWNWSNGATVNSLNAASYKDLPRRVASVLPVPDATAAQAVLMPPTSLPVPAWKPVKILNRFGLGGLLVFLANAKMSVLQVGDALLGGRFAGGGFRWIYHGAVADYNDWDGAKGWANAMITPDNVIDYASPYVSAAQLRAGLYDQRHLSTHEIGHTLGRPHDLEAFNQDNQGYGPCNEFGGPGTPLYPLMQVIDGATKPALGPMSSGTNSLIYGLDTLTLATTDRNPVVDPHEYFDLMSYCAKNPLWIWPSSFTYRAIMTNIMNNFGGAPAPAGLGPLASWWFVQGWVDRNMDEAGFLPSWTVSTSTTNTPTMPQAGNYLLRVFDAASNVLEQVSFLPAIEDVDEDGNTSSEFGAFLVPVPVVPGMHSIQIVNTSSDQVLATMTASSSTPSVNAVSISDTNGGPYSGSGPLVVHWTGVSADPNALLMFNLQYSTNGGGNWENIDINLEGNSYQIDSLYLPASVQAMVRVIASDGFQTSAPMNSSSFTVPNHPPVITIYTPDNSVFTADQQVYLEAAVADMQDGPLTGAHVQWNSSLNGLLGSGATLSLPASGLSEGRHTITVTATDNANLVSTATVTIVVLRQPLPDLNIDTAAHQIFISWPASVTNFDLLSTTNLVTGPWTTVATPAQNADAIQTVTLNATNTLRFFQLRLK